MRILNAALIVLLTIGAAFVSAQQASAPAAGQNPSDPATDKKPAPLPTDRIFGSVAGLILNPIRPDKVDDFELVLNKIHEALAQSTDPERKKQAAGWRAYKATETVQNGAILYVFAMDPAVPGADYTVSKILSEAFPEEVRDLWRLYTNAFAGSASLVNLKLVETLGAPFTPKPSKSKAESPKPDKGK